VENSTTYGIVAGTLSLR